MAACRLSNAPLQGLSTRLPPGASANVQQPSLSAFNFPSLNHGSLSLTAQRKAALPNRWKPRGFHVERLESRRKGEMKCRAAAEINYDLLEERAKVEPCEQAPHCEDLVDGTWFFKNKNDQRELLVADRLALRAKEIKDEILSPERLTKEEIEEIEEDPNVALILNVKGQFVGTYIGSEEAVARVRALDPEEAVVWFWNRLEENHYRRFMEAKGEWWRGEEWEKRPPHWYEYKRKDGKRVVWGQETPIVGDSLEDFTFDTLESWAKILRSCEETKGSLASQPEGSHGRFLRELILESRENWLVDGTISPPVSDLEAGDETWSVWLTRKWKEFKLSFKENRFDTYLQGFWVDDRVGQQYYVPNKFGWKGPTHRTM